MIKRHVQTSDLSDKKLKERLQFVWIDTTMDEDRTCRSGVLTKRIRGSTKGGCDETLNSCDERRDVESDDTEDFFQKRDDDLEDESESQR